MQKYIEHDPDLLVMFREGVKGQGKRNDLGNNVTEVVSKGNSKAYTLQRLKVIADNLGWHENMVKSYSALLNYIVARVLETCEKHNNDDVTGKVARATFLFTEGWFRT